MLTLILRKEKKCKDLFSQNLYKLLNNCIHRKSIENICKRINVKFINDKKVYQRCANKATCVFSKIIDKNFVSVHCSKKVLTLNRP